MGFRHGADHAPHFMVRQLLEGLGPLLARDGFRSVREAIGADHRVPPPAALPQREPLRPQA